MERLSGLDAAFLSMETPSAHMHVMATIVLDPATAPGGWSYARVREHVAARLPKLPPFRRRVVRVPFDLYHPLWIEDPDFDLEYHVRRAALPAPGGLAELAAFTADVASRPLDRAKPLWEIHVVEGLEGGHVALVGKVHHSAIDGISGIELIANLFDLEPAPAEAPVPDAWRPDRVPSAPELLGFAALSLATQPVKVVKAARNVLRSAARLGRRFRRGDVHFAAPLTAPWTPLNGAVTPHRRVAFASVPLDDVKLVKRTFDATMNDVVLAIAGGAIRQYLERRGSLPDAPLVAVVPQSVRRAEASGALGNQVSAVFAGLATHLPDPVARLVATRETATGGKVVSEDVGHHTLQELAEVVPPRLLSPLVRAYSNLHLADRHRPIHNLVISNVPGPSFPIFCAGARTVAFYPMGPIFEGAALNLTVVSYLDRLDFGFMACRETLPDLDDLAACVADATTELVKSARDHAELAATRG